MIFCIVHTMCSTLRYQLLVNDIAATVCTWHYTRSLTSTIHIHTLALLHIVLVLMNCLLIDWLTLLIYLTMISSYSYSSAIGWWTPVPALELTRMTCYTSRAPRRNHLLLLAHVTAWYCPAWCLTLSLLYNITCLTCVTCVDVIFLTKHIIQNLKWGH